MRVISGVARGIKLNSIDSTDTRPTIDRVKESLFNIIQPRIADSIVLDLFAGTFSLGFVCNKLKRNYIGIELSSTYCKYALENLPNSILDK